MNISIRQHLTLWYTGAMAVLLGVIAISLVLVHGRVSLLRLDAELARVNATVAAVLQNELDEGLAPRAAAEDCLSEVVVPGRHVAILSSAGVVLAQRWSLPWPPAASPRTNGPHAWTVDGETASRALANGGSGVPPGFVIVSAATWSELAADRADIVSALAIVIPIALVLASAGAWWVAGRALKPAGDMAAEAQRINEDLRNARLTVGRHDELGRLAVAFNGLLDRLEAALSVRRQFLADASHELRTPVSIARTAADVALSRSIRTEAEYRDSLTIVSEQMKGMGRMVADMLAIARSDASDWPIVRTDLYLDELLIEVARAMRLLADDRQVTVESNGLRDVQISGDEMLLRRMFLNLVENAIRHTPAGGTVHVATSRANGAVLVDVRDTGGGIPAAERDRIFDRFVRVNPHDAGDGVGLGLAIAQRIARAHGGDLILAATSNDGTTFEVRLPVAERDDRTWLSEPVA